jgi:hypothetical protein
METFTIIQCAAREVVMATNREIGIFLEIVLGRPLLLR